MRNLFTLLFAVFFLSSAIPACGMGEKGADVKGAPGFSLKDLGGKDVALSDFKGKIVFLNFWATWCPPCKKEMPSIEKLHRKFGGRDFTVLAVAVDVKGEKLVRPYIEEKGYTFPVLLDPKGEVSDNFDVFGVPMTFIIGRDGEVLNKIQGERDWFSRESIDYFEELIGKGA